MGGCRRAWRMVLEIGVGEVGGEDCEVFLAVYSEIVMGYQCSHGY